MKRKLLFTSFLVLISISLKAQEDSEQNNIGKIGITYSSFGSNEVIRFASLAGAASYDVGNFYTFGINYLHPLNSFMEIETGIEYSNHDILIIPNLPPDMDNTPRAEEISLLTIPMTVRANFLKYFFFNGGLLLGIDNGDSNPIDSQSGLGGLLGVGSNYEFDFGVSLFINPYIKSNALLPFSPENYHQRLMQAGVRLGIAYNL